jgi:hypothetical protein
MPGLFWRLFSPQMLRDGYDPWKMTHAEYLARQSAGIGPDVQIRTAEEWRHALDGRR